CPRGPAPPAGWSSGSRTWRPAATPSRPPTRRSSCCCATNWPGSGCGTSGWSRGGGAWGAAPRRGGGAGAPGALNAKGERIVATGEGNGPVNALDNALRLALERLYPELAMLELADYKVRILENSHGTGAVTRVLIESGDGTGAPDGTWSTVGVDENIIAASWHALEEAVTYALLRAGYQPSEGG